MGYPNDVTSWQAFREERIHIWDELARDMYGSRLSRGIYTRGCHWGLRLCSSA
jgi:hypothetical protein